MAFNQAVRTALATLLLLLLVTTTTTAPTAVLAEAVLNTNSLLTTFHAAAESPVGGCGSGRCRGRS